MKLKLVKKWIALGATLFACMRAPSGAKAQTQFKALEKEAIRAVLSRQLNAWNRGDIAGFMEGYIQSDSLLFMSKSGLTFGWQKVMKNYQRAYPTPEAMGKLQFEIQKIQRLAPKKALVIGKWLIQTQKEEKKEGYFSLILCKIKKQWYITFDHTS
jgi:uncharacterized protein (TIGR02246 family)